MQLFFLICALVAHAAATNNAFNHVTMQFVPQNVKWLEVGFMTITRNDWTSVTATYKNFKDPVVFLSSPQLAGETSNDGNPMSLRIKDVSLRYVNPSYSVLTFKAKSFNVNSSFCTLRSLYTKEALEIPDSHIGWLVVEKGKFNITNKAFLIHSDVINRTTADGHDTANYKTSVAPSVCDFGQPCRVEGTNTSLLSIAQLQTTRYERFLLLRGTKIAEPGSVVYILQTPDSLNPAGYVIPSPGEDFAWMIFERGVRANCDEKLVLESFFYQVTYIKLSVTYYYNFTRPPAIFGMINTIVGRDSTGLRSFNLKTNGADFLTQEDKCSDSETDHVNLEATSVLVVGDVTVANQKGDKTVNCGATFNWESPESKHCVEVGLHDTFGNGWGANIALRIWSDSNAFQETYLYNDCSNRTGPELICFPSLVNIYFDLVTFVPPAQEWWEIYWTVRTLGKSGSPFDDEGNLFVPEWYLGDFDTNMTVMSSHVDVHNPVVVQNLTCDTCSHPKPKPKPKASPKGSSSESESETESSEPESKSKPGPKSRRLMHSSNSSDDSETFSFSETNSTSNSTAEYSEKEKKAKPSWPFPITLYDSEGNGWFNQSDKWVMVPVYSCNQAVDYRNNFRLPEAITNPEYIITDYQRTTIVRKNTICGDLSKETCEERLSDGDYIFRVTGALSRDDSANSSSWSFCGAKGRSMEELAFKIVKGKCVKGPKISAKGLCCGVESAALFDGILVLSNVAGIGVTDVGSHLIESVLAESFSSVHGQLHSSVALVSWEFEGSALTVHFRLSIDPSTMHKSVNNYEFFEELTSELLASGQSFIQAGLFVQNLQTGLAGFGPDEVGVLAAAAGATLVSLEYVATSHKVLSAVPIAVVTAEKSDLLATPYTEIRNQDYRILSSFEKSMVLVFAAVVGTAIVVKMLAVVSRTAHQENEPVSGHSPLLAEKSVDFVSGTHGYTVNMTPERFPDFN